jgi:hypothetical protein
MPVSCCAQVRGAGRDLYFLSEACEIESRAANNNSFGCSLRSEAQLVPDP